LANAVVPHEQLLNEANEWAEMIASRAPVAVRNAKHIIQTTMDSTWKEAMSEELDAFVRCQATKDHKHAIEAFFNKEKPVFIGQ